MDAPHRGMVQQWRVLMRLRHAIAATWGCLFACLITSCQTSAPPVPDVAVVKPGVQTGFANAGWKYDRYDALPVLEAGKSMRVADLVGPGIINQIHVTRHQPKEIAARGVVLEIWFDDADVPAVHCPLADFFGDGCNGKSEYFTSLFIECAPWSYNCYIPMPFKTRAQVYLRNDTDQDLTNYTFVEWEPLPEWDDRLGYFHATYARKCFQLTPETNVPFFHVDGAGHILGRQFSVVTDEPAFEEFMMVMEGNNEIDIDGRERQVDYLGTEDSFTFSWGFQNTFAGLRAGMPLVKPHTPGMLSIYRFHDHQPIRFEKSLRWSINWSHERHMFASKEWMSEWEKAIANGGCWVDYAAVYYWYQTAPGGFAHAPLESPADRAVLLMKPPESASQSASAQRP